jgi:threonine synthase
MPAPQLRARQNLSSANSINLGRLLPQAVYYAATSIAHWRARAERLNFIIPSGNLGNAVACIWARHMGLPIGEVISEGNVGLMQAVNCWHSDETPTGLRSWRLGAG